MDYFSCIWHFLVHFRYYIRQLKPEPILKVVMYHLNLISLVCWRIQRWYPFLTYLFCFNEKWLNNQETHWKFLYDNKTKKFIHCLSIRELIWRLLQENFITVAVNNTLSRYGCKEFIMLGTPLYKISPKNIN